MNKFLTRIVGATLGFAMAIGVGAGIGAFNNSRVAIPMTQRSANMTAFLVIRRMMFLFIPLTFYSLDNI